MKAVLLTAMLSLTFAPLTALGQDGDPAAGANVFKRCAACHNVENDKSKIGPSLQGLLGRQPGTVPGFAYSAGMKSYGEGKVWDEALLKTYLPDPRGQVKGTKMAFAGLKKEQEVLDVIAYLKQFSPAN